MLITGMVTYNKNGALTEKHVGIDTSAKPSTLDHDVCDAVSFALYGKTIFGDIVRTEIGVPFITLNIDCKGKSAYIVRQPQYLKETAFGNRYLSQELFSLKTKDTEYESLSAEKYYELINDVVDMSYDEFVSYIRS